MGRHFRLLVVSVVAVSVVEVRTASASDDSDRKPVPTLIRNGSFEAGLTAPWGVGWDGQSRGIWTNQGACQSTATIDRSVALGAGASLHIANSGPQSSGDCGEMVQFVKLVPDGRYRLTLWARARNLVARNAVAIVIEGRSQSVLGIGLDQGTYDWTPRTSTFVAPGSEVVVRIVSSGAGEAWLDELYMEPQRDNSLPWINVATPEDRPMPIPNGGFETGLSIPWGTGPDSSNRAVWWNRGNCKSRAVVDRAKKHEGDASLHVVNDSPRSPNVYGTTQQPLDVEPGRRYRIGLWAAASNLATAGAVSVIVDSEWKVRPIQLPQGTYDWRHFSGEFCLNSSSAQVRIISEDRGEVWLDDLEITPLDPTTEPESTRASRQAGLAAAAFRQMAVHDYRTALDAFATPAVIATFRTLDEQVWGASEPRASWCFFLNTSVVAAVIAQPQEPLVAFYNPWCDSYLITAWNHAGGPPRLVDVEMLMGDWVRTRGEFPSTPIPGWLRSDTFKPAAVGMMAAESARGFETVFAGTGATQWRTKLPGLNEPDIVANPNYLGVAFCAADALTRIDDFRVAESGEHPRLAVIRAETQRFLTMASEGRIDDVLREASQTTSAMREILHQAPASSFGTLTVVSTFWGTDADAEFLAPAFRTDCCVSLLFTTAAGRPALRRIDCVFYQGIYEYFKSRNAR